jgi:hypothetical protein
MQLGDVSNCDPYFFSALEKTTELIALRDRVTKDSDCLVYLLDLEGNTVLRLL